VMLPTACQHGSMTSDPPVSAPIDSVEFRAVLGHFATGVTVVTAQHDGALAGLAANAFSSVSLEPPLVLMCVALTSRTWPLVRASGAFAVNFLGEDQEDVCRRFGAREGDRFAGAAWKAGVTGSPLLSGALAYVDCRIEAEHEAGDHLIVVGRVVDLGRLAEGRPLIFWRGTYVRLAE
jgi:3-hydroxy-9,10-secoandrosta-1,3,5(10)-triene-9,17-dione monooxygenase reductase component